MRAGWSHFDHGADIGIRGEGPTLEQAFEQAALALTAVTANPEDIRAVDAVEIACRAPDDELLFLDWINALIYAMATRGMLFGRFRVRLGGGELRGTAWGEAVDVERHRPAVEVKGATCTNLRVAQTGNGGWVAECVVDV
jgi:SHS2 domain-containing protein